MASASSVTAGTDITLSARDTIAVGLLTAGAAGTVTITSTNGAITDANGAANNIAGLNLVASAATGIDLDTAVANITATTTGVGAILIDEANTVTLTSVTTANGPITITTGGATTVTSVVSTTDTDANDISITAATGDITVATVTAGAGVAGDVTLAATTGNIFDDGANATVITSDVLTLTADRAIGAPGATAGMDSTANSLVATTTGAGPFAGAPTPGIWVADTDALVVTSATTQDGVILIDAARTAAGNLTVGIVNAGGTGRIVQLRTLTGAASNIDFGATGTATALADTIRLVSTGAVTESGSANKVIAGSLSIVAAAGIATAADPLNTSVTNLAFQNSTTGAVNVRNNGALTIAAVGTVTPSFNNAAAQPTILAAVGPLTFAVNTTSAGDLTATAIETADAPTFADDLTIDSGITVRSTGGNVLLQAGDDILMNAGSLAQSDLGSATLTAAFGDLDSEGSIAMASASSVTAGTDITLSARDNIAVENLTSGAANAVTLTTTTGAIAENASGRITARTMTTISVHGTQLDSAPNAVSSFNAVNSASGSVSLTNSIPLNVMGIVQTGGGLVAVNNALKLTVSGGVLADTGEIDLIALAGGIDLNTANTKVKTDGTVLLNSVAGDVTESASAQGIIGGSIALQGTGAFLLPNILNDAVRNFRANTSGGTVTFRDANDLTIDPLNGVKTNSNDLTLLVGTNFTSEEGRAGGVLGNAPLVDAGANGNVVILPGLAGPSHFRFASEIFAKTASFGNVVGLSNNGADQFEIRPSTRTRVLSVAGNDPRQVFPGDTINPITDDPSITNVELIQDSNGPEGLAGRYRITYADGSVSTIEFKQIESFGRASFKGIAVQTGARDYAVRLQFLQGSQAVSSAFDLQAIAANPFVVSPSRIDPNQQYSAPSIAFGDVNGDGQLDLVIANGANDAPLVTIFDGRSLIASSGTRPTGTILKQFYAFTDANGLPTFRGGLSVAIRTNGTKPADIVLGPGPGGGPVVQIWGIANNFATPLSSFFAYEAEFRGGVNVAAGDYNGDGKADIIVGAGPGGGPRVRVFDNGDPSRPLLDDFFAYDPSFRGGVLVDAGQFDGNKGDDIVTAPGAGGGPHIKVFSINIPGSPNTRASFFAWDVNQSNGLQSLGANANNGIGSISFGAIEGRFNPADNTFSKGIPDPKGRQEILASSARGAPLQMRRFQFANASAVSFTAFTDLFADLTAGAPLTDPATKAPLAESQLSEGGSVAGALPSS